MSEASEMDLERDQFRLRIVRDLRVIDQPPPEDGTDSNNDSANREPGVQVDVIHVVAMGSDDSYTSFEQVLPDDICERMREMTCRCEMGGLLSGSFATASIEEQATRLLDELATLRGANTKSKEENRAIIFVAYELASLVVKQALILAEREDKYSEIFDETSHVIFWGCPQRSVNYQTMEAKLSELLQEKQRPWSHLVTAASIFHLARAINDTTEALVSCKATLHSQIITLFAANPPKTIPAVFDYFTASVGLSSEALIQETNIENKDLPELLQEVFFTGAWRAFNNRIWKSMKKSLRSLSAPQYRLKHESLGPLPSSLTKNEGYIHWKKNRGFGVLLLHGTQYENVRDTADCISLSDLKMPDGTLRVESKSLGFHFAFEATDPQRNSISGLLVAFFPYFLAQISINREVNILALRELFDIPIGWTEEAGLKLFRHMLQVFLPELVFVLHDFDQCNAQSRRSFVDFCQDASTYTEIVNIKVVVTSQKPEYLSESKTWTVVEIDSPDMDDKRKEILCGTDLPVIASSIRQEKAQISKSLDRLAAMERSRFNAILDLLCVHTGWPKNPSPDSLKRFSDLLDQVSVSQTPQDVLDGILQSTWDRKLLHWTLHWLTHSYRPLTRCEFAAILSEYQQQRQNPQGLGPSAMGEEFWCWLESQLRVLVEFSHDRVTLRSEIRSLLDNTAGGSGYFWNTEQEPMPHQRMTEFCITQLSLSETNTLLEALFQDYQTLVVKNDSKTPRLITAPMAVVDKGLTSYAVQALPYHLRKCSSSFIQKTLDPLVQDPLDTSFTLWAKAYWAMSSPFHRTTQPPGSALSILLGYDSIISYGDMERATGNARTQCMVAAAGSGDDTLVEFFLQEEAAFAEGVLADMLQAAIRSGNESLALKITQRILTRCPGFNDWDAVLWLAVWRKMDRLVDTLLSNGTCHDEKMEYPGRIGAFLSLLDAAAYLGHLPTVEAFLRNGAEIKTPRGTDLRSFGLAIATGKTEMVQAYLSRDSSLANFQQSSIFHYALQHGSWNVVDLFVQLGADPNFYSEHGSEEDPSTGGIPLALASSLGYVKTVEALLRHGANPNKTTKYTKPPLSKLSDEAGTIECTRSLLQHGSDPNLEDMKPPLAVELASSKMADAAILEIYELLLSNHKPIDISAAEIENGTTPLMMACFGARLSLVKWLLQHGVDVDSPDKMNRTVLHYAAFGIQVGHADGVAVLREILQRHPQLAFARSDSGHTALHYVYRCLEAIELLLDAGADPQVQAGDGLTPVSLMAAFGGPEVIKALIRRKVNVDTADGKGVRPVFYASAGVKSVATVRLLADHGVNLSGLYEGYTLLELALKAPPEMMELLLRYRKVLDIEERNADNETPLLAARENSNMECLRLLVQAGANINAQDTEGVTPLGRAFLLDMPEYSALLLAEPDLDVAVMSPYNGSPLHIACLCLRLDGVVRLLEHGADVNSLSERNYVDTPLISALLSDRQDATMEKKDQIARILIQHGSDVQKTLPGHTFYTAVAAACMGASTPTVQFLLDEGASAGLADPNTGRLPLHYAAANDLENFQTILAHYRGDMMVPDRAGKNCLHWASEFGRAEIVAFILDKLEKENAVDRYINQEDKDGWSPLCWASRPFTFAGETRQGVIRAGADFESTIRTLLRYGAAWDIKFQWREEVLTPFQLARRHDADAEVLKLLKYGLEESAETDTLAGDDGTGPIYKYAKTLYTCDFCLMPLYGLPFQCQSCTDYDICTKCLGSISMFHNGETQGDGKPHIFEPVKDRKEYDTPAQESRPSSEAGQNAEDGNNDSETNDEKDSDVMSMEDV